MRVSPIFLTAACTSWLGVTAADRSPQVELSTEYFLVPQVPDRTGGVSVASVVSVPGPNRTISIFRGGQPGRNGAGGFAHPTAQSLLRQQPWALPLAALSAAAMIFMAGFEVFVLLKARAAVPSRRHLFLGQVLLLGLFLLAGLSAAPSLAPNPISCGALRLIGLPAALVFAALLVKCVFLLSLNSGVYLPAPYQALVLVFAILVQVAIIGQWFYGTPSNTNPLSSASESTSHSVRLIPSSIASPLPPPPSSSAPAFTSPGDHPMQQCCCSTPVGHLVASLGYASMLLISVGGLAIRARGLRDNNGEAAFIGLAVGASLPVWVSGGVGALTAREENREAWLAYALLATSLLVFLLMFLPKGRQLAALGRENATVVTRGNPHDRDDGLSSLPASGYSPSFFHFKPPNDTLESKMLPCHQSTDRVALVSSGIPNCTACRCSANQLYPEDLRSGPVDTFVQLPPGMYLRPEDAGNLYTTMSANPNVFFQRAAHPGMMY
ncbi:uncharacterized protein LOC124183355 [Neodiprion fabricii]|uniref:uncharacterized protein LOC124183355 n=1 Tax=Neodiprion fabricii TaxID=2872261 RepID=UPI001ED8E350|nr:uncharacterized protein LOC124183355 [Neodiprion fabricii]